MDNLHALIGIMSLDQQPKQQEITVEEEERKSELSAIKNEEIEEVLKQFHELDDVSISSSGDTFSGDTLKSTDREMEQYCGSENQGSEFLDTFPVSTLDNVVEREKIKSMVFCPGDNMCQFSHMEEIGALTWETFKSLTNKQKIISKPRRKKRPKRSLYSKECLEIVQKQDLTLDEAAEACLLLWKERSEGSDLVESYWSIQCYKSDSKVLEKLKKLCKDEIN